MQDCLFANFNSIRVWGGGFYPHDYFFEPVHISCVETGEYTTRWDITSERQGAAKRQPAVEGRCSFERVLKRDGLLQNGRKKHYLSFAFEVKGEAVSSGTVLFTKPKHFRFVDPKLEWRVEGDEIVVKASAFAKYVFICNENDDMILSDNFFDMDAGEKRVKIVHGVPGGIKVKSVYDIRCGTAI